MVELSSSAFFDIFQFSHSQLFEGDPLPWIVLQRLTPYLNAQNLGNVKGIVSPQAYLIHPELIFIDEGSVVEPGAYVQGPCIIGKYCTIRHGAYVRGDVLTGDYCVIGHDTEVKHSIFLNHARADHFAYIGDSILGNEVGLGAGVKCANLKLDSTFIELHIDGERIPTNARKLGTIIGDKTKIGCNTVINPGTLICQEARIYPSLNVEGYIPFRALVKPQFKPLITIYEKKTD